MKSPYPSIAPDFSLREARTAIQQYLRPNPVIYWVDFLTTILIAHFCFGIARSLTAKLYLSPLLPNARWTSPIDALLPSSMTASVCLHLACTLTTCLLFYRAAMFIHELVHLRRGTFRLFRATWNVLCGIPFLMPSFVYHTHLDHHRREDYGTARDGEYLPLGQQRPAVIFLWLLHPLFIPPVAVFRFLILTPLAWLIPPLRRLIHERASSMIIDPSYIRPLPSPSARRTIYLQEFLCFAWCLAIPIFATSIFGGFLPFVVQAYFTGVVLLLLNALRTLGAHRWVNSGERMTFIDQLLDSVNYPHRTWITGLWGPIGLRYHALHHLFPSLPYHNFAAAHRALMEALPENSPYRKTTATSLTGVLFDLYQRSAASQSDPGGPLPAPSKN